MLRTQILFVILNEILRVYLGLVIGLILRETRVVWMRLWGELELWGVHDVDVSVHLTRHWA